MRRLDYARHNEQVLHRERGEILSTSHIEVPFPALGVLCAVLADAAAGVVGQLGASCTLWKSEDCAGIGGADEWTVFVRPEPHDVLAAAADDDGNQLR